MDIYVLGLSHRTAPLDMRERLAFDRQRLPADLADVVSLDGVAEAVVLSTCNRVEVYATVADSNIAAGDLRHWLATRHDVDAETLEHHLYERSGEEAVGHAFRVASSLDSMVVGETQISGQVKEALAAANGAGTVGPLLTRCFQRAFQVAKRVRSETGVGRESVNVSSVAVDLALKIFGGLDGRSVLLVGAGTMSDLAARKLKAHGVSGVLVANRSRERAEALATDLGGTAYDLAALEALLVQADIVLVSTASEGFVIDRAMVARAMKRRKQKPLFIIDTSVPRNVDPKAERASNVYLYDIDDLQRVVAANQAERQREARDAEKIVASEVASFTDWQRTLDVVPTIVTLREHLHAIQAAEVERVLSKLDGIQDQQKDAIRGLGRGIVNKVLHGPVTNLKRPEGRGRRVELVEAARMLFNLDMKPDEEPSTSATGDTDSRDPIPAGEIE
jgi:glutamyl-tRNA reductase